VAGSATEDRTIKENTARSTSALLADEVGPDPIKDRPWLNACAKVEAVFWLVLIADVCLSGTPRDAASVGLASGAVCKDAVSGGLQGQD